MNRCLECKLEISDKASFCSDKHRMAYRRRTKQGEQPEQNDPEHTTRTLDFKPTRTDQAFEDSKPNYYNFDGQSYERTCIALVGPTKDDKVCGKQFTTHLKLLKFCSPQHMSDTLNALSGIRR